MNYKTILIIICVNFMAWLVQAEELYIDRPASTWQNESFLIGNGSLGAMSYGGVAKEKIHFNEDSLWLGTETNTGSFQPFGQLVFEFNQEAKEFSKYSRTLSLNKALHKTSFEIKGTKFYREAFASFPNKLLSFKYSSSKKAQYSGRLKLIDAHNSKSSYTTNKGSFSGKLSNGQAYEAQVKIVHKGGTVSSKGDCLEFKNCDELIVYLVAGTDYIQNYTKKWRGEHPHKKLTRRLSKAELLNYEEIKERHVKDYQKLYERCSIKLGETAPEVRAKSLFDRLNLHYRGQRDPELEVLLFQLGRYLLIASSRQGSLPANLQGLWNTRLNPPWRSDYHSDINVQMNYWHAEVTNLSECHQPFFDYINSLREVRRKQTQKAFKTRGWTVHVENGIFGGGSWFWNKPGAAWYGQHLWEHYQFTKDKKFLKEFAYPIFKEISLFWFDHLKEGANGKLICPKGYSMEHGPWTDGVAYDHQYVWDAFTNLIDTAKILKIKDPYVKEVSEKRSRLLGPKIGSWGQVQEWLLEERDNPKDKHRHLSHLVGFFPGRQFKFSDKKMMDAIKVTMNARGDGGAGWALPWKSAIWARLKDGNRAYKLLANKFKPIKDNPSRVTGNIDGSFANLLNCVWSVFQIEGNFGYTAAVSEMLLQSHEKAIEILPALPAIWQNGEVKGLKARGNVTIDITWQQGKLKELKVRSAKDGKFHFLYQGEYKLVQLKKGKFKTIQF